MRGASTLCSVFIVIRVRCLGRDDIAESLKSVALHGAVDFVFARQDLMIW